MTQLLHQTKKHSQNEFSNTWRDRIVQVIMKKVWVVDQWPWLGTNPTVMQKFFERKEDSFFCGPNIINKGHLNLQFYNPSYFLGILAFKVLPLFPLSFSFSTLLIQSEYII
jgi:hypothetical protein